MTSRQANALTAVGLAGLMVSLALTAPRWSAALRAPAVSVDSDEPANDPGAPPAETPGALAARRISVRLYFQSPDREGLLPEEREITASSDLAQQLRTVVGELARGSTTGLLPTLPPGTRVLEVFVHAGGVAYVNLSAEATAALPGGSRAELLTVFSLVNTIVTNFPATSRVQLLVNDQVVGSLGGHVDLSRPLPPDMTLVALPRPETPPEPAPPSAALAPRAAPAPPVPRP